MDNQDTNNSNSATSPNDDTATIAPVQSGLTPQAEKIEEEKELEEIEKLKNDEEKEELADAKKVDDQEKESKIMDEVVKKDPKLILTEDATPVGDEAPDEKT